ncbi:MAG: hypothetical protein HFG46_00755 [Clostridium sp.]|nr:hypothetical protein [Clostridium sp.]
MSDSPDSPDCQAAQAVCATAFYERAGLGTARARFSDFHSVYGGGSRLCRNRYYK